MAHDLPTEARVTRVGFLPRLLAELIDLVVTWAIALALGGAIWAGLAAAGIPELGPVALVLTALVVVLTYWTTLHAHGRQTVGKRAIGAVVVDLDLRGISHARAFGRLLAEAISAMPFYLGYLWCAWDPDRQTFHDKIAGTVVVRKADLR